MYYYASLHIQFYPCLGAAKNILNCVQTLEGATAQGPHGAALCGQEPLDNACICQLWDRDIKKKTYPSKCTFKYLSDLRPCLDLKTSSHRNFKAF